jgi:DNA-binding XRE family transcriptional regulator
MCVHIIESEGIMFRSKLPLLVAQKESRERRKITQEEIAEATGLRRPTISAWMSYKPISRLESNVASVLCAYFDCTIQDLVELENGEEIEPGQPVAVA